MRFVIAAAVRSDIKSIRRYTRKKWGAQKAAEYVLQIHKKLEMIRRRPLAGVPRPNAAKSYRAVIVGSHIIFYRLEPDMLEVVRVLHQRMDAQKHLDS